MTARQLALCGVLTALAASVLMLGGMIPAATFAAPLLAMALLLPLLEEYGPRAAGTAYAAAGRQLWSTSFSAGIPSCAAELRKCPPNFFGP